MKKVLVITILSLCPLLGVQAQTEYKLIGNNLITNSTFDTGIEGWTSSPANNVENQGWRWDNTFIYGSALWIDRAGTTTASSNPMNLCQGYPKRVKLSFLSSNTGEYELKVKLGGQTIGTFKNNAGWAQSTFTPAAEGVDASIIYNSILETYPVTDGYINNNIWHDFTLTVSSYTGTASGSLTFEYTKTGVSRQVYLDNVEVYEIIPTPVPTQSSVNINCGNTYNLNQLKPASTLYDYTWYTDATRTTPVTNPTAVGKGIYYLFASSTCTGANHSYPSQAVVVDNNCCGSEIIKNGTFDGASVNSNRTLTSSNAIPNWTATASGLASYKHHYVVANSASEINDGANLTGFTNVHAFYTAHVASGYLEQSISNLCIESSYKLSFNFTVNRVSIPASDDAIVTLAGKELLRLTTRGGAYNTFGVTNIASGVTVKVGGVTPTGSKSQFNQKQMYLIEVDIAKNAITNTNNATLKFTLPQYYRWYLDNVSLKALPPAAETPRDLNLATTSVADGLVVCPNTTFDLTTAEPNTSGYKYMWYTDATGNDASLVQNPKASPAAGNTTTYYMKTINTCTGCESTSLTPFIVVRNCPTIQGTVYNDWDGAANGGIDNQSAVQNAELYALLVSPANTVLKSMQLTSEGTYSFVGEANTDYYVMISDRDVATGSTAPTAPAYAPGSVPTGETINGALDGTADGKSTTFNTGTASATTINFGINRIPVQGDVTSKACGAQQNIALTSTESQQNWNSGTGKKLVIQTLSAENGTLKYNGTAISSPRSITNFDPTMLVFERADLAQNGVLKMGYAFEDAAGQSALNVSTPPEPAKVSCTLKASPEIQPKSYDIGAVGTFTYKPENGTEGNVVPTGTSYSWTVVAPEGVTGAEAGTASAESGISATLRNSTTEAKTVTYNVTASVAEGCSSDFTITTTLAANRNVWTGAADNDWNNLANWSLEKLPTSNLDIEFADGNNPESLTANRDLIIATGKDITIQNLINNSEKALVVSPGASVTIKGDITGSNALADAKKIVIKSNSTNPNGSFIVENGCNKSIYATVEMYSKASKITPAATWEGEQITHTWQYFGSPVEKVKLNNIGTELTKSSGGTFWLRHRKEEWNDPNHLYRKWSYMNTSDSLKAFWGYEVTQDAPDTYLFKGKLNLCPATLTLTRKAAGVTVDSIRHELGEHVLANSYTAALNAGSLVFDEQLNKTVYLYNTGHIADWQQNKNKNGDFMGGFLSISTEVSTPLWSKSIPSMQGFVVKYLPEHTSYLPNDSRTLRFNYTGLKKNSEVQRAPAQAVERGGYLRVVVSSENSADAVLLIEKEGATPGFDNGWDGIKIDMPQTALFIETEAGNMQIAADETIIGKYISFRAGADDRYTITITKDNLGKYSDLKLIDLATKKVIDLSRDETAYKFSPTAEGKSEKRFLITRGEIEEEEIAQQGYTMLSAYMADGTTLVVSNLTGKAGRLTLHDLAGRTLQASEMKADFSEFDLSNYPTGVYLVTLRAGGSTETVKVVVR